MTDTPEEITIPGSTIEELMARGLMGEMERVGDEGGTEALIAWLDGHGLRWRAGGSDPTAAIADAIAHGGVEVGGPLFEPLSSPEPPPRPPSAGPSRAQRRKAAHKNRKKR